MMGCRFCKIPADRIVLESDVAIAFRDAFPVNKGHTVIVPRRHVEALCDLTVQEQQALRALVEQVRKKLVERFTPEGFDIPSNTGPDAEQAAGHAYIHVIPRCREEHPMVNSR